MLSIKPLIRIICRKPPELGAISTIEDNVEAENAAGEIIAFTDRVPFCGLDCEWVGNNRTALLQISVFNDKEGFKCYLFRLCKLDERPMPLLHHLLNSESVIKLGVGIDGDFKRLVTEGYVAAGNQSFLDLRFLAVHSPTCEPGGLAALVRQVLKRKLDKDWRIRASNWEENELTQRQMIYAADDSLSALQTFAVFMDELGEEKTLKLVQTHLNSVFKGKQKAKQLKTKEEQLHDKVHKRIQNHSNFEDQIKSYATRKAPLYDR